MAKKPLLPGFSKAMIKRHKIQGDLGKLRLYDHAARCAQAIIKEAVERNGETLQNTFELIDEIWEQD